MDLGLELNKNKVDRNLILKGIGEITQFLSFSFRRVTNEEKEQRQQETQG